MKLYSSDLTVILGLLFFFTIPFISNVQAQDTIFENGFPIQPGIAIIDKQGVIKGSFPFPGDPTDVEAFPTRDKFAISTRVGEFLIVSGNGERLFDASFTDLYDVDILPEPNQFLLTSRFAKRVFFLNIETKEEKELTYEFEGPSDADLLPSGNLLVCDARASQIIEFTPEGHVIWRFSDGLKQPMDALRLEDGNTLISDFDNHRIIEIQPNGEVVWEKRGFDHPIKIYPSGENTFLIADSDLQRIVELTRRGDIRVIKDQFNRIQAAHPISNTDLILCAINNSFKPPSVTPTPAYQPSPVPVKAIQHKEPFVPGPVWLLAIALLLWLSHLPFKRGNWFTRFCCVTFSLLLVIGIAFHTISKAASSAPYIPSYLFWLAALLLCIFAYRHTMPCLRPKALWSPQRPIRFPYSPLNILYLLIVSCLALLCQYLYTKPAWHETIPWYVPMVVWGFSLILLLRASRQKHQVSPGEPATVVVGNLPLAVPFSTGSVSEEGLEEGEKPPFVKQEDPLVWYLSNSMVILTIILGAALYIIGSTHVPTDVHGDECEVALHGIQVRDSGNWNIFNLGWYHIPNLFYLIPAWVMWLFGDDLFGLRMAGALAGVGAIPVFYLLARRLFNSPAAAIATFLFTISTATVHFSRMGTGYNQTILVATAVLFFFVRGLQQAEGRSFILAGFLSGVGLLSYQANHLIPLLIIASFVLLFMFRCIPLWTVWVGLTTYLLALWVTAAPLVGVYLNHPDFSYSRARSISYFYDEGHKQIRKAYPASLSEKEVLLRQLQRSSLATISHKDDSPYLVNPEHGGLLDPIPAVLFIAGCFFLLSRLYHPAALLLLFWTATIIAAGGIFTSNTPSYQRLIGTVPFLLLIAGPILYAIIKTITHAFQGTIRFRATLTTILCLLILIMGMQRYFHRIQAVPQQLDEWTRIARYIKEGSPHRYTYFLGPPAVYFGYGTIRFLAPNAKGEDVMNPPEFLQNKVSHRGPVSFVLVRGHRKYINDLRRLYPGGKEESHYNSLGRQPFTTYEVNF